MAGRQKKTRNLATVDHSQKPTKETQDLFDEATGRLQVIEHDDLERDSAYQKLIKEVEYASHKGAKTPYNAEVRLQAALAYEVFKSSVKASELTGVPSNTIRRWKQSAPWWNRATEIARMVKREGTDADYQKIQDAAHREALDRIDNGDVIITSRGEQVRRPMSGKDLMTVAGIARDKQSVLRGQPTSITEKVSEVDRLEALAEKITKAVQGSGKVIEGVVIKDDN